MPPRYFDGPNDDSLEGTAISISRDNGKTWSEMPILFDAGRHHANLQRLPNGDLVCTLVVRDDIQDGKLVSHRRGRISGCWAVPVSGAIPCTRVGALCRAESFEPSRCRGARA
jgi:hypothetical protein